MQHQTENTQKHISEMVHKLKIGQNLFKVSRKRASVAHKTRKENAFIDHIYRPDKPQGRLQTHRVYKPKNRRSEKGSNTQIIRIGNDKRKRNE